MKYDVIVVGAGPAGSSTAYNCVQRDLKTLIIDARTLPGTPKQCAEGIGKKILEELNITLKPEWISREIESLVYSNFTDYFLLKGKRTAGYVLDRKKFDYALVERAKNAGAELLLGKRVIDIKDNKVILNDKSEFEAKVIVGADGPLSTIGKKSGLGNPKNGCGLQYEIKTKKDKFPKSLQCYLNPKLAGYFWIFPKKDTLNVGVGSVNVQNLKPLLDKFVKKAGLENELILETNAGMIPLHGRIKRFQTTNILLVGDAAGHTNPLSGGGIPVAIYDGILASKVIKKHINGNYSLENYQELWWDSNFGKCTKQSLKTKELFIKLLNEGKFNQLLKDVSGIEYDSVFKLIKAGLKVNGFKNKIRLFWMIKGMMRLFKYAW